EPPRGAPRVHRQLECTRETYSSAVKEFVLEDAPAGTFNVIVHAGEALNATLQPEDFISTFCPAETFVTIGASGEQVLPLNVSRRGGLRMELRDSSGVYPTARCTLRNAGGQELPIVL